MNVNLKANLKNREVLYDNLKEEFIGPCVSDKSITLNSSKTVIFDKAEDLYKPYKDQKTGEEILQQPPSRRYGTAVLYPLKTEKEEIIEVKEDSGTNETESLIFEGALKDLENIDNRNVVDQDDTDLDMVSANAYQQSSMAVSFKADFPTGSELVVHVDGGRYYPFSVKLRGGEEEKIRRWWVRVPVHFVVKVKAEKLLGTNEILEHGEITDATNIEGLDIQADILSRPLKDTERLVTVSLINRTQTERHIPLDSVCFFQASFKVEIISPDYSPLVLPYPEMADLDVLDEEELSIALLYRKTKTYAVGHGCSADWSEITDDKAAFVQSSFLPSYETKSMTPDITRDDGSDIVVSMRDLAGIEPGRNGMEQLEEIVDLYEKWIEKRREDSKKLDTPLAPAAEKNLQDCDKCVKRMKQGLDYLKNPVVAKAFRLANEAMLLQQVIGGAVREAEIADDIIRFASPYQTPDLSIIPEAKGKWRAFQIAFILMAMESSAKSGCPERETVELIFFPTGGGKTEAYLGLAAFSIFMRRLMNKTDAGVHVLMRYTLRLLTADQFQRASRLICAMESIRHRHQEELGSDEFSIGIWLGGDTTPNSHTVAKRQLAELKSGKSNDNPFLINSCPWCGAKIGKLRTIDSKPGIEKRSKRSTKNRSQPNYSVHGYKLSDGRVLIHCTDNECLFSDKLPIYVVDEDIYEKRPTFIIGTVDKFAQLAWNSRPRSIFGIGNDGTRISSPPGLIIQDELHLISGPLGSMSGIFEVLIEELCTDYRTGKGIKPKIICSTATIRRYQKQILDIYDRKDVALFPAPGLDADDSFFATYARDKEGKLMPGRKYVGLNAPGLGSMQTLQVRSLTSLLQAPMELDEKERDPWWTLLIFFNSLRELGTTVTLLQSDIPNHLKVIKNREDLDYKELRHLNKIKELTSRLSSDEVASAINELKIQKGAGTVTDVCLASNIIEVGVDIDRLSLMAVIGQPKTTAQYIQVTGRIGRRWYERPGLVVTLYSASKPRDRSHFEKFRSYHEKLYAQVEPTSVTPFSPTVVDRMLHAVMVGYVRQFGHLDEVDSPSSLPEELLDQLWNHIRKRVESVDYEELENVRKIFDRRIAQWKKLRPSEWSGKRTSGDYPLIYPAGSYVDPTTKRMSWATPNSMRNVDSQCLGEISALYVLQDIEELES
ncbi:helicase-related protein [Paenibacillus typhae]|uniref:helicase-related protein n=1 Tax=Paenibacillus typhae TaxID=1174501 RepID=UPI001C8DBE8D|nr:helicase-related protein [Paenibacillus typhae]MBY0011632.1 helicase [Paenibacillus typhae]